MTKWDHFKNLTQNKKEWDVTDPEMTSTYEPYLMNALLSNVNMYLQHVVDLNQMDIDKETHYRYLFNLLPKTFVPINEIKIKKRDREDEKYVAKYFEFGTRDLKTAMELLTEKDIKNIKKKYGILK